MFYIEAEPSSLDSEMQTVAGAAAKVLHDVQGGELMDHPGRALDVFNRGKARMTRDADPHFRLLKNMMHYCESPIERDMLAALVSDDAIVDFIVQVQAEVSGRRIDIALLDKRSRCKFAIECDGADYHTDAVSEMRRDAELAAAGYFPIHVRGKDIWQAPIGVSNAIFSVIAGMRE